MSTIKHPCTALHRLLLRQLDSPGRAVSLGAAEAALVRKEFQRVAANAGALREHLTWLETEELVRERTQPGFRLADEPLSEEEVKKFLEEAAGAAEPARLLQLLVNPGALAQLHTWIEAKLPEPWLDVLEALGRESLEAEAQEAGAPVHSIAAGLRLPLGAAAETKEAEGPPGRLRFPEAPGFLAHPDWLQPGRWQFIIERSAAEVAPDDLSEALGLPAPVAIGRLRLEDPTAGPPAPLFDTLVLLAASPEAPAAAATALIEIDNVASEAEFPALRTATELSPRLDWLSLAALERLADHDPVTLATLLERARAIHSPRRDVARALEGLEAWLRGRRGARAALGDRRKAS